MIRHVTSWLTARPWIVWCRSPDNGVLIFSPPPRSTFVGALVELRDRDATAAQAARIRDLRELNWATAACLSRDDAADAIRWLTYHGYGLRSEADVVEIGDADHGLWEPGEGAGRYNQQWGATRLRGTRRSRNHPA
jgi:hypothetical protein